DGLGGLEELALEAPAVDLHRHRLSEVAAGDRPDDLAHLRIRPGEVLDQVVDGVQRGGPSTARVTKGRALDLALFADALAEPLELALEPLVRFDDLVESGRDAARCPRPVRGHPSREVTALDGAEDVERDARIHRVGDYDPTGHEMRLLSRDSFWCCTLRAAASASGRGARSQAPRPWIWRSYAVGNPERHGCAGAGLALEPTPSASQLGSLAYGDQPEVPRQVHALGDQEAGAVVGDGDLDSTVHRFRLDRHSGRVGVLLDVADRLGDVPVDDRLDRLGDSLRQLQIDIRLDAGVSPERREPVSDRIGQANVRDLRRRAHVVEEV